MRKQKELKTSKFKGVNYDSERRLWIAVMYHDKKRYYIGRFLTEAEASEAYQAAVKHHIKLGEELNAEYDNRDY